MITHKQIEAFKFIMMAGTATQAAKMLEISQPAVSRLISSLEYELGFKLFIRSSRQLLPTFEARMFYDDVEKSFVGLARLKRSAEAILNERTGKIALVSIPSLASSVVVDMISDFNRRKPDIGVSLDVQSSQRLFERVVSHEFDLGITTLPLDNPAIEQQEIATGNAVCIMPTGHRLCNKDIIRPEDFEGESFIDYKSNSAFRQLVDDAFLRSNVTRKLSFDTRTTGSVVAMVRANLGVSVIEPEFSRISQRHGIETRPFLPDIPVILSILSSKQKPLSHSAESFLHICAKNLGGVHIDAAR